LLCNKSLKTKLLLYIYQKTMTFNYNKTCRTETVPFCHLPCSKLSKQWHQLLGRNCLLKTTKIDSLIFLAVLFCLWYATRIGLIICVKIIKTCHKCADLHYADIKMRDGIDGEIDEIIVRLTIFFPIGFQGVRCKSIPSEYF